MGLVHVTGRVAPLSGRRFFETEFLVDTGAVNCLSPGGALKKIGVRVEGSELFELANGATVEYPFGFVRLTFLGACTVTRMLFGPEDCEPLLGVIALEDVGIGVDPVSRTRKRMTAKPLKRGAVAPARRPKASP
jgi:predicted aspartyl protease